MDKKLLRESVAGDLTKKGNRWKGVLAKPGQGSSGYYSEDVLKEYGPRALAPGAKAFVEHNPERPVRDMIGVYPDGAYYEEGIGLVGELEVFPHWREFVEAVAPHTGLSIYMMGESDEQGNITSLVADRQNGVDLVSYPGLDGSGLIEKLYESAKAFSHNGTSTEESRTLESKEPRMEIEELAKKVDTLAESVTALLGEFTTLAESLKPAEPVEGPDLAAVVDAVAESGLPKPLRSLAIESIQAGKSVEDAIKAQVAIFESVKAEVKPVIETRFPQGRVMENEGDNAQFSLKKIGEKA